jgi:cytochrome c553
MTRPKIQSLPTTVLIATAVLALVLSYAGVATAGTYAESAHGDTTDGVNRSGVVSDPDHPDAYDTGSCAHCHDTFDPDICGNNVYGLMLFASNGNPDSQTDNFCFECHIGTGYVQVGGITNHTYSTNFGGGTATLTSIYDAFNPTTGDTPSSHQLSDIQNYVTGNLDYTSETNPCIACHSHHFAQKNYPVTATGMGGVKTAVRRSAHYSGDLNGNLWGDEDSTHSEYDELIREVTDKYQAPYYKGETTYEPANDGTDDGSNLPNFVTLCLDCHKHSNVPSAERQAYLENIDWYSTERSYQLWLGDAHGNAHGTMSFHGETRAPYNGRDDGTEDFNFILACTDCHEPHGSKNAWLLRTCVNGKDNINVPGTYLWYDLCTACHWFYEDGPGGFYTHDSFHIGSTCQCHGHPF